MFIQKKSIRINTGSQYTTSANTKSTESIARSLQTANSIQSIIQLAHEIVANEARVKKAEAHENLITQITNVILEEVESGALFTHTDIVDYLYYEKHIYGDGYEFNHMPKPTAAAGIALERLVASGYVKKIKIAHCPGGYRESYLEGFMKL